MAYKREAKPMPSQMQNGTDATGRRRGGGAGKPSIPHNSWRSGRQGERKTPHTVCHRPPYPHPLSFFHSFIIILITRIITKTKNWLHEEYVFGSDFGLITIIWIVVFVVLWHHHHSKSSLSLLHVHRSLKASFEYLFGFGHKSHQRCKYRTIKGAAEAKKKLRTNEIR